MAVINTNVNALLSQHALKRNEQGDDDCDGAIVYG